MNTQYLMMNNKYNIMEVIYCFKAAGSETLAASLASYIKKKNYNISVCATHIGFGPISDLLSGRNIPCFAIKCDKKGWLAKRYALYKLFKKEKITHLHIHHMSIFILCYWPARFAGVKKIIVTEHTEYEIEKNRKLFERCKRFCKKADLITVIHKGLIDYFKNNFNVAAEKIKLIANGVDTDYFKPLTNVKDIYKTDKQKYIIGCVARFHEDKDHKNLINAFKILTETFGEDVHLWLLGGGHLKKECEKLVETLGLKDSVHFLGEINDVEEYYTQMDLFVLPSKTEGVPLVLLEAMSSGIPCVATRVGGIPELVESTAGRLVEKENSAELAKAMLDVLSQPEIRENMAKQSREQVLKNYKKESIFQQYLDLIVN